MIHQAIRSLRLKLDKYVTTMLPGIGDTLVSMLPQIVGFVTGILGAMLLARSLGPDGVGIYALILSIPTAITNFSDLGIGATAIRYASRAKGLGDEKAAFRVLRWAFQLRMAIFVIMALTVCALAPFIASHLWHKPEIAWLLSISLLVALFGIISAIPVIYFQVIRDFRTTSAIRIVQLLIGFCGILALYFTHLWKPEYFIFNSISAGFVSAILFIHVVPKECFFPDKGTVKSTKQLNFNSFLFPPNYQDESNTLDNTPAKKFAAYMVMSSIAGTIMGQTDIWLISYFCGSGDIGIFSSAGKFTLPMLVLLYAINTALWPRISGATNYERFVSMVRKIAPASAILFAGSIFYSLLLPLLMPTLFGKSFAPGIGIASLLCLRYSVSILFNPLLQLGYAIGMAKWYWKINLLQLALVVGFDVLFLPVIGPIAAAWALILSEVVGDLLSITIMIKTMRLHTPLKSQFETV